VSLLIKNGRVIDPANNLDDISDVFVSNGVIETVRRDVSKIAETVVDAAGCWVVPGFIDLHVHLREPGYEYKETIAAGSRAAVAGGFTTICCMPNTSPVIDSPEILAYVRSRAGAYAKVLPIASITLGQKGERLSDMALLKNAGAYGFSEDGKSVLNALIMKQALEHAATLGLPVLDHCEDINLANGGVINEGEVSRRMKLPGIPSAAEDIITARDLLLAESAGAQIHICHISTAVSARLLKEAKARGVNASGEVCPHHFCLCDEDIPEDNGNYKMNPPLRSYADMEAMRRALADDVIDIIATDHAPHSDTDKTGGFLKSAFGVTGLETALGLCITVLVNNGVLSPSRLIRKLTVNPARTLGINAGTLSAGALADIAVIDPERQWAVNPTLFISKGKNTPFGCKTLSGMIKYTVVNGRVVYGDR
jgi:dihydroorotase